jgi:RNA polymerase sigma-70 factor, ECF subfamily
MATRLDVNEATDSDEMLVARVMRRDESALEEAVAAHAPAVYGLARMIIGDESRAEEVAQDTMLALWEKPEAFDPSRGGLRRFLLGIARNKAIDLVRREASRRRTAAAAAFQPDALVSRVEDSIAAKMAACYALRLVNPQQRQAIFLAYFAGLTYREVARQLGVPEGTVKTRIRDGLTRMRAVSVQP